MMYREGLPSFNQEMFKHFSLMFRWWADENMNYPPPKSQGRTVMTSDFVTILDGVLAYNDEEWERVKDSPEVKEEIKAFGEQRARRAGCVLDVSSQGYYNTERCIPDFEKVFTNQSVFFTSFLYIYSQ